MRASRLFFEEGQRVETTVSLGFEHDPSPPAEASMEADLPEGHGVAQIASATFQRHLPNRAGALADYIPELATVEPESFGIAIATAGGTLHSVGDADQPFTIQSVSKAFAYCLALELAGRDEVVQFREVLARSVPSGTSELEELFRFAQDTQGGSALEDDFSILRLEI